MSRTHATTRARAGAATHSPGTIQTERALGGRGGGGWGRGDTRRGGAGRGWGRGDGKSEGS